jgi:hypothetical protein
VAPRPELVGGRVGNGVGAHALCGTVEPPVEQVERERPIGVELETAGRGVGVRLAEHPFGGIAVQRAATHHRHLGGDLDWATGRDPGTEAGASLPSVFGRNVPAL